MQSITQPTVLKEEQDRGLVLFLRKESSLIHLTAVPDFDSDTGNQQYPLFRRYKKEQIAEMEAEHEKQGGTQALGNAAGGVSENDGGAAQAEAGAVL